HSHSEDKADTDTNRPASTPVNNGSEWSWQNSDTQGSLLGSGRSKTRGNTDNTTRSGISEGTLVVAGEPNPATADELNRTVRTGDESDALRRNWDPVELAEKVKAEAGI